MGSVAAWMAKLAMAPILAWLAQQGPLTRSAGDGFGGVTAGGSTMRVTDPNAEPLPIRDIARGENVAWSTDEVVRPMRLRADGVILTIRTVASEEGGSIVRPQIEIEAPGLPPARIEGADARIGHEQTIGIGRLDRNGTRFVYYQGFTGGAHCCRVPIVAVIGAQRVSIIEMGSGEGGPDPRLPRDVSGDGIVDFVARDDRFMHAFGGTATSHGPPRIFNIRGEPDYRPQLEDVSMETQFRPLFLAQMREDRAGCVTSPQPESANAECARYVAAAARAGRFDQAWREMLRAPTGTGDLALPIACRFVLQARQHCPARAEIRFTRYPDALRHFLRQTGYIEL